MAGSDFAGIIGPSYHLDDKSAAIQSAINCFPQKLDGKWMMASAPGCVTVNTLGEVRGSIVSNGRWFVVAADSVYEMSLDGTVATEIGTLLTNTGFVGMDDNNTEISIVDGDNLYILDKGANTVTQSLAEAWRGSNQVRELDGYFIFTDPDTDQFYLSAIDSGADLDALDFSSADSSPDNIITHRVTHRQLWLLGDISSEIWIDSGGADFPFVRYNSYTLDVGCVGKDAAINAADTMFFIGKTDRGTAIVYMIQGNQPVRVSTLAVENALKRSTDITASHMWAYQTDGHEFIGITAPGLETTWVYDAALQQWHERGEWDGGWQPLRWNFVTSVGQKHFALSSDGNVARLDETVNQLSGRHLVRERTWPHMANKSLEPIIYTGIELAMSTGYGGNVTLEISNDGGQNFGPPLLRSLGATGRWNQRVRWNGLGASYNRVHRVRLSDPVPFAIYSATVGTS